MVYNINYLSTFDNDTLVALLKFSSSNQIKLLVNTVAYILSKNDFINLCEYYHNIIKKYLDIYVIDLKDNIFCQSCDKIIIIKNVLL